MFSFEVMSAVPRKPKDFRLFRSRATLSPSPLVTAARTATNRFSPIRERTLRLAPMSCSMMPFELSRSNEVAPGSPCPAPRSIEGRLREEDKL